MEQVTVEWCIDNDGDLAIKRDGEWYSFMYSYPSQIYPRRFFRDSWEPFTYGRAVKMGLTSCETQSYTYR